MTTLDELEKLYAAAQFTEKLCVSYDELGPDDNRRLYAFLMEGDPDDGVYVAVDEDPWTNCDPPSPRLEAISAAINALPGLLAICNAAKTALGCLDNPTGGDEINDMRRASDVLRAALKAPPTRAQGESS